MYSLQPVSRCCQDVLSLFRYQTGWNLLIYQAEKRNFDFQKSELRFLFQKIYCEEVFYNVNILPTLFQSTATWPLITSTDKPENFSHSTASRKHCFRNHDSRTCQPMPKHCTVSCSTAWAFLLKMAGWTSRAGYSSSSQSKIYRAAVHDGNFSAALPHPLQQLHYCPLFSLYLRMADQQ